MPVFNLTIDDTCPLIQYTQGWSDSSDADSFKADYINGTFHATDVQGATASLTFNGSAVYIFGAKRPNHDIYAVTLDQTTVTANGNSDDPNVNLFNQLLFNKTNIDPSQQHQVVLRNQYTTSAPSWVDVDYMIVTAGDGNQDTQSSDTTWDDGNDAIVYSADWDSSPNNLSQDYFMGTMHRTSTANASASINFNGNAISVYGATSGNHGLFSVSVDGQTPVTLNGTAPVFRPQNLVFWAGGLPDGQHTVKITNLDAHGLFFDLDKVVVSKWPDSTKANGTSASSPTATQSGTTGDSHATSPSHTTAVGPIVGGVVAGVVALALVLAVVYFFTRRRARSGVDRIEHAQPAYASKDNFVPEPFTIEPFNARNDVHEANERSPLSPGMAENRSARAPNSGSFSESRTQVNLHADYYGARSEASKYILPYGIAEQTEQLEGPEPLRDNPHMDFPPPDYEQAVASGSSRSVQPAVQAPTPADITAQSPINALVLIRPKS